MDSSSQHNPAAVLLVAEVIRRGRLAARIDAELEKRGGYPLDYPARPRCPACAAWLTDDGACTRCEKAS